MECHENVGKCLFLGVVVFRGQAAKPPPIGGILPGRMKRYDCRLVPIRKWRSSVMPDPGSESGAGSDPASREPGKTWIPASAGMTIRLQTGISGWARIRLRAGPIEAPCSKLQGIFHLTRISSILDSLAYPAASCGECARRLGSWMSFIPSGRGEPVLP